MFSQAVLKFTPRQPEGIYRHRKENKFAESYSLIDLDSGKSIVDVRFYYTNSRAYCCLWVHIQRPEGYISARGSSYAGGYGYHRASAAMDRALREAGFEFGNSISGVGESAMRDALQAIANYFELNRIMIHHAHA